MKRWRDNDNIGIGGGGRGKGGRKAQMAQARGWLKWLKCVEREGIRQLSGSSHSRGGLSLLKLLKLYSGGLRLSGWLKWLCSKWLKAQNTQNAQRSNAQNGSNGSKWLTEIGRAHV